MFKYLSLLALPKPRKKTLLRQLRRLAHERNFWRNRTKELRGKRRR
jgi:hypothetical protein